MTVIFNPGWITAAAVDPNPGFPRDPFGRLVKLGLLIGGALGALAGIFFAPKSGKELRSNIREKGSEVLKDGKEIYADASAKAKEIIEEAKHQAKELKKDADRHLSEARQKAKEILARGEKKEAEAGEAEKVVTGEKKVEIKRG